MNKLVVFVGDEPSILNTSQDVAFVGSRSFKNLIAWISFLNPTYYITINSNKTANIETIKLLSSQGFKIVALGQKASERMHKAKIAYFSLPHPSPKNRSLNDAEGLQECLNNAKAFIESDDKNNISWRDKWKIINKIS
jgi:hypothetical protein